VSASGACSSDSTHASVPRIAPGGHEGLFIEIGVEFDNDDFELFELTTDRVDGFRVGLA
jgi:hypothetical protein